MPVRIVAFMALLLCVNALGADETVKTIGPDEAAGRVDQLVTLKMQVKSAALRNELCFLNSEENYRDDKNFTVFIGREAMAKFKEAKIPDPAARYKGKTIVVRGKVTLHREKPQIAVTGPDQIKVLETKNIDAKNSDTKSSDTENDEKKSGEK